MKEALNKMVKQWREERNALCKVLRGEEICDPYRKYLENSVYIVPPNTLLAYEYLDGINIPVQDQTVWIIDKYEKGYFFGKTYTALNGEPKSDFNMSGSITPSGEVYITFFSLKDSGTNILVRGIGKFVRTKNSGYFLMQTNSAENSTSGLSHWSYMISVTLNDYWYQNLPALNISVPEFINSFST